MCISWRLRAQLGSQSAQTHSCFDLRFSETFPADLSAPQQKKCSHLEVEAKCLETLAGDSDLLTGDPQPGDAVLSLRSLSL